MEEEGTESYYIQDDLGSPMGLMDGSGNIRSTYAFDEFGVSLTDGELDEHEKSLQPFGYTGYQRDEVSGLYFAQARRYDAWNGRFVSKDSDKFIRITRPDSFNQYLYCDNNPEKYIDPSGNMYYIFYIDEFENDVYAEANDISEMFNSKVEIVRVSDTEITGPNSFVSKWNENIIEVGNVDGILIHTHGDGEGLYGKDGTQILNLDTIQQLNNTEDIESIVLIACDTANDADKESWNLASAFSTRFENTVVVASNGNVWYKAGAYTSMTGDITSGKSEMGEPYGWYGYYYKNGILNYKYGKNYPDEYTKAPYILETLYIFADMVRTEKE